MAKTQQQERSFQEALGGTATAEPDTFVPAVAPKSQKQKPARDVASVPGDLPQSAKKWRVKHLGAGARVVVADTAEEAKRKFLTQFFPAECSNEQWLKENMAINMRAAPLP